MSSRPIFLRAMLPLAAALFSPFNLSAAPPAAPTNLGAAATSATAANATIELYWQDNASDETGFSLEYRVGSNPTWLGLGPGGPGTYWGPNTTSVTWSGAALNTVYNFRVTAYKNPPLEVAPYANTIVTTTAFGAPSNFSVQAVDAFNLTFTWQEASYTEAGYSLEYRFPPGAWQILGAVGPNALFVGPVALASPLTSYEFRVRGFKGATPPGTPGSPPDANTTAYSNVGAVTTPAFSLTATPVSKQPTINLSWPNVLNEARYDIYWKPKGELDYSFLATTNANVSTYAVTTPKVELGGAYSFIVVPINNSQQSMGESPPVTATADGISSLPYAPITRNTPFSYQLVAGAVGTTRTAWSIASPPAGLTFNSTTGILSGTPTVDGVVTCPMSATFANGFVHNKNLVLRILSPPAVPQVLGAVPDWNALRGQTRDTTLSSHFADPETTAAVRITTTLGAMDWILYQSLTPQTVANFLTYISGGDFVNTFIHRSLPGFVIQGGGYRPVSAPNDYTSITRRPSPQNEPGISNLVGTLAMAKSGGNPNSATSEFFVSLADNSANLDNQNGGFTVFGRVAGQGMSLVNAIAGLPTKSYPSTVDGQTNSGLLANCPLNLPAPLPAAMDQSALIKVTGTQSIPVLNYSILTNTDPTVVSASVSATPGHLNLEALKGGTADITVRATDLDNNNVTSTFHVTVTDTFTAWAAAQGLPPESAGPDKNPDGDVLANLQEYSFLGNPSVASAAEAPSAGAQGNPARLQVTFPVRKFTQGLSYAVEAAAALSGPWQEIWSSSQGLAVPQVIAQQDLPDRTIITVQDNSAVVAPPGKRFVRVRVTQQ